MARVVEQDILGFEVAIDHLKSVQALQSAKQFCGVEASSVDIEALLPLEMVEQFTAVDKGKNKIELLRRLERELQGYNEGVVDLREHGSLCESVCDFRSVNDVSLADCLQGVDSASVFLPVGGVIVSNKSRPPTDQQEGWFLT